MLGKITVQVVFVYNVLMGKAGRGGGGIGKIGIGIVTDIKPITGQSATLFL